MTRTNKGDGVERRDASILDIELRLDTETGAPTVSGYASVFNSLSEVLFEWDQGRFREQVAPGAFRKTIKEQNIPLLIEHANLPLASTGSGTLMLSEDEHGLRFESQLDPTDPDVQRVLPKMRRKDMSKMSFGFIPIRETWDERAKPRTRTLHEVRLVDVSIVARPAYMATEAKVRRQLADDGLDAESLAEMLVRLRQGLELSEDDLTVMRRLVDTCQRHLEATVAEVAPGQAPHSIEAEQPATSESAPNQTIHPLSWYKEQLRLAGV